MEEISMLDSANCSILSFPEIIMALHSNDLIGEKRNEFYELPFVMKWLKMQAKNVFQSSNKGCDWTL